MAAPDDHWHDVYRDHLRELGRLTADAKRLDSDLSITLAQQMTAAFDLPEWKAKAQATASFEYQAAAAALNEATRQLELARAAVKDMENRWETWRSRGANARSGFS